MTLENLMCIVNHISVMKMKVIVEEGASTSGEVSLDLADYAFSEESITVAPRTVITWTNQDSAQHNVAFE
jgi:hypothetical protein